MNSKKDERKLLRLTYFMCLVCFFDLFLIKQPFDKGALIMGVIICFLIAYGHFVVRRFYPDGDKYILVFSCILSVIGITMLYRLDKTIAIKQIIWFAIGIAGFIIITVVLPNIKRFDKYKYFYLVGTIIFMALGSLFGHQVYGAKNWISVFGMSFQPSEFGKLFLIAYLASSLKDYKNFRNLIEPAIVVMVTLGFMVLQKDLGSALIIFAIAITMLYIGTSKFKYIIVCVLLFVVGAFISYTMFPHIRSRVMIWKNPWPYANDQSLQVVQSMVSIASGGIFGSGLGLGHPDMIPVISKDFIFSALCEEFGIMMGFGVILLYFLLFYRCMRAAVFAQDKFSMLSSVGYSTMIASQAIVIIGGVTNMIPLTGITLPLVSYGGSSMLITFFALAIVQKVSEEGRKNA